MSTELPLLKKAIKEDGFFTIFYQNQHLYSPYTPVKTAQKQLPAPTAKTLYFLASPLLGYALNDWLKLLPPSSYVIWFEADSKLRAITEEHLASWQTHQLEAITASTLPALENLLTRLLITYDFETITLLKPNAGFSLYEKSYQEIYFFLNHTLKQYHQNQLLLSMHQDDWLKNIFLNREFLPHFHHLTWPNNPVLLVGAGLSTYEDIPLIKNIAPFVSLCCVDTVYPLLKQQNIEVDAIFVVESGFYNSLDFIGALPTCNIVADLTSYPFLLKTLYKNAKISFFLSNFNKNLPILKKIADYLNIPLLPPQGSVAITALAYLLTIIQNRPIILSGFDFCYKLEQSHAKQCYSYQQQLNGHHRLTGLPLISQNLQRPLAYAKIGTAEILSDSILLGYYNLLQTADEKNIYHLTPPPIPSKFKVLNTSLTNYKTALVPNRASWGESLAWADFFAEVPFRNQAIRQQLRPLFRL